MCGEFFCSTDIIHPCLYRFVVAGLACYRVSSACDPFAVFYFLAGISYFGYPIGLPSLMTLSKVSFGFLSNSLVSEEV